jgi:serine/threonine-protein kinase
MSTDAGLPAFFGRYQVLEELGAGSMGVVYLCVDPRLARPVAVKILRPLEAVGSTERQLYEARFRNEAEAAGRLNHPGIVQIYDVGPNYLVMEFLEGKALSTVLKQGATLTVGEIDTLLARAAEAIDYAHRNGIVHRDIKPANIMLLDEGGLKVLDFGVAHLDSSTLTAMGTVLGSVRYMAPEQMMGQKVDGRADVFSLAAVAYELLTCQAPFPGKTITEVVSRVVHGSHVPPREVDPRLPARANEVFSHGLAVRPVDRPATAEDFVRELQESLREVPEITIRHAAQGTGGSMTYVGPSPTNVAPARETPTVAWTPAGPRKAVLNLESDPPGAKVFLDGNPAGQTPLFGLETAVGRRVVRFEAAGRAAVSLTLDLSAEQPLRSVSVNLPEVCPAGQAPAAGRLVPFGPDVFPPRKVGGAVPAYPEAARARGIEGAPVVDLLVGEEGQILDAQIVESAGALLDGALLDAVAGWRFSPALLHGVPVTIRIRVQHVFRV